MMENGQYSFYAFLSRMKHIRRWSLMRNTVDENVMEHSYMVALIAHALAVIRNTQFGGDVSPDHIAVLALFHDASETLTGDLPTPIKYFNPAIQRAYQALEDSSRDRIAAMLPESMQPEYKAVMNHDEGSVEGRILKAADRICAYVKCVEEGKNGNSEFEKARQATLDKVTGMALPEADWFMAHFMESFSMTLDELNG